MPNSFSFAETAGCTPFIANVVCPSSAAPAFNVDNFALALAH
jgi:hypothetical protein